MREIKFRGRRKYGKEWLIGDLNHIDGNVFIFPRTNDTPLNSPDWFEVDPKTVGQFTGLKDMLLGDLYEGDIVQAYRDPNSIKAYHDDRYVIKYLDGRFCQAKPDDNTSFDCIWFCRFSIMGNIHDNPKLLKQ